MRPRQMRKRLAGFAFWRPVEEETPAPESTGLAAAHDPAFSDGESP